MGEMGGKPKPLGCGSIPSDLLERGDGGDMPKSKSNSHPCARKGNPDNQTLLKDGFLLPPNHYKPGYISFDAQPACTPRVVPDSDNHLRSAKI